MALWICNILQRCTAPRGATYITAPLHICVRPLRVARSTIQGNARASKSGTSDKYRLSRFFFFNQQPESGESTGHDGLIMKQNKNEELQSRRQFFKKAAKATLPILGAIVATNLPFLSHAAAPLEVETETSCDWGCSGGCTGSCGRSCSYDCSSSCRGGCSGACSYTCQNTCKGSCHGSCSGGCSNMSAF